MKHALSHENHDRRHLGHVARAAQAHLEPLQNYGVRGWSERDGAVVRLSEYDAQDCAAGAFERLLHAIAHGNETVLKLVEHQAPDSRHTYRMLQQMFRLCAYDMRRTGQRDVLASGLSDLAQSGDGEACTSCCEDPLENPLTATPQAAPTDLLETCQELAHIVASAFDLPFFTRIRQIILLAHLRGRENTEIAEELGLKTSEVQRHLQLAHAVLNDMRRAMRHALKQRAK